MNQLIKNEDETLARIKRFFIDGDITLSPHEQTCLKRWAHAHTMVCQRKHPEATIIQELANVYGVSIYMARSDLYNAQTLYGETMRVNKKLLLSLHAENIQLFIEKCRDDKSLTNHVPKLMAEYTKAIEAIPDDKAGANMPPPVLNFYVTAGQQVDTVGDADEAHRGLRDKLRLRTEHVEDIEYDS